MNNPPATLLAWTLALGCFYPSEARGRTDIEKNELKGPVRTVLAYEALFLKKSGKLTEQKRHKYLAVTFDRQGRMSEKITYSTPADRILSLADAPLAESTESRVGKWLYNYDADGKRTTDFLSDYGRPICTTTHVYQSGGARATAKTDCGDGFSDIEDYTYDDAGNLIEYDHRIAGGQRIVYSYDERGNQIEEISYSFVNLVPLTIRTRYFYNKHGFLSEIISDSSNDSRIEKASYLYDDQGNLLSSEIYDSKGNLTDQERYTFRFDSKRNWIKKVKRNKKLTLINGSEKYCAHYRTAIYRTITYY